MLAYACTSYLANYNFCSNDRRNCNFLRTLLARTNHHPELASNLAVRPSPTQEQARATLRESKSKAHSPSLFFSLEFLFIMNCLVNILFLKTMPIVSTCEHLLVSRAAVELADQLALHWWSGPSPICMQLYIHNHILF